MVFLLVARTKGRRGERHLVPPPTIQQAAGSILVRASPLLEEERPASGDAVVRMPLAQSPVDKRLYRTRLDCTRDSPGPSTLRPARQDAEKFIQPSSAVESGRRAELRWGIRPIRQWKHPAPGRQGRRAHPSRNHRKHQRKFPISLHGSCANSPRMGQVG